jgi:protein SCO1/2
MKLPSCCALLFFVICGFARSQTLRPDFAGIGIEQHLRSPIPLDLVFRDEAGIALPLRTYFGQKPVLLVPVYFRCPMLCSQVLKGTVAALRPLSIKPGRDFELVAVSFDPADSPSIAKQKRDQYWRSYSSRSGPAGWHFLTGDQSSIKALMQAIGFHYRFDAAHQMFIHASGIMVLTPDGYLARYLYGVDYEPKDVKLSLIEASHNRIGSPVDQILLFCYHYDPKSGKYGAVVMNLLRSAALLTLAVFAIAGWFLFRRDLREYRA